LINENSVINENEIERDESTSSNRIPQLNDEEKQITNGNISPLRRKNSKKIINSPKR
jgi:hypothetical protein